MAKAQFDRNVFSLAPDCSIRTSCHSENRGQTGRSHIFAAPRLPHLEDRADLIHSLVQAESGDVSGNATPTLIRQFTCSGREAEPEDAPVCGRICYEAFTKISTDHAFPPDFPSVEVATGVLTPPQLQLVSKAPVQILMLGAHCVNCRYQFLSSIRLHYVTACE